MSLPEPRQLRLLPMLAPAAPTTREVAHLIRAGGVDALTDADHRADAATYQEVVCRSALNAVTGMPFRWTLNPYRGCTHACHYCFARRYHAHFELDAGDQFASVILVKRNVVEVARRELARATWRRDTVALGTATDPYQPIEGHYKLTRGLIQSLATADTAFGLVTKGPMVVRDIDVLLGATARAGCTVYVSVPSVDERAWKMLEPGTAHPMQRLRAVRELSDAGIRTGVLMAPIVPGLTSSRRILARTMEAIADHGARLVGYDLMRLDPATKEHFMAFVERERPNLHPAYRRLYQGKRPPHEYAQQMADVFSELRRQFGLDPEAPARSRG